VPARPPPGTVDFGAIRAAANSKLRKRLRIDRKTLLLLELNGLLQ